MQAAIDRTEGWRQAMEQAGLATDLVADGDFTRLGGATAMRELLARDPHIDAVFVSSDLMANGAIGVLQELGRDVPGDVSVVGFDDSPSAMDGLVALTTVHQPSYDMGEKMATMLLRLLRGEPTERECIMPTTMVVRASA
jgi:LacI family transcriptional regulator